MKYLIAFVAALVTLTPNVSSAHDWHQPMRHIPERGHGWNPWPFVAGAVVGGIIVHEYNREPTVITSRQPDPPVLVNGVLMQRTYQCVQNIVTDRYGNEQLMNRCNWVFVPVQVQPPPSN